MDVKDIKTLKEYLTLTYHKNRIKQQEDDEKFANDIIDIPYLPPEIPAMKTGKEYRMVSARAEHIIASNPQCFRIPVNNADEESAKRIASVGNKWLRDLSI